MLEKEPTLAGHQTGHNSGVIHSGLYYKPGSAKARTCTDGRKQLVAFAKQYGIPHEICGKIIVATSQKELPGLERIFNNGIQNGIEGVEKINPAQIKQIEPYCAGIAGIKVPCTGIIDFVAVVNKLAELIQKQNAEQQNISLLQCYRLPKRKCLHATTDKSRGRFEQIHHQLRRITLRQNRPPRRHKYQNANRPLPRRLLRLEKRGTGQNQKPHLPLPDPQFPFLGVHFTRMVSGGVECGPNAVFSFKREGYGKFDFNLRDAWESLTYPGTLKLFIKHWRYGLGEYVRAFSKKLFVKQLQRLVPSIQGADLTPGNSGVRAQAVGADGKPIDDFVIEPHGSTIHVLNAPSPAATASLAIADHITSLATQHFKL